MTVEARTCVYPCGPSLVVVAEDLNAPFLDMAKRRSSKSHESTLDELRKKSSEYPKQTMYQVAGEMLAAAMRWYDVHRTSQTIFALRILGMHFRFFLFLVLTIYVKYNQYTTSMKVVVRHFTALISLNNTWSQSHRELRPVIMSQYFGNIFNDFANFFSKCD